MTEVTDRTGEARTRRFQPYPEYRDSGVEWLGEIPAHWDVKRLKFITHIVAGQSPPSVAVTDGMNGLPFLQGNAEFGPLNPTPHQVCDSASKRAKPGDILLSVRAPVGAMNVADQAYGIGRGLCAIRPATGIDRSFCFYEVMAMRPLLDAVATGSTYDAVTAANVGDLPVLLPQQVEQRAIAAFLDRETAKIDGLVERKERLIELLQEKRTALITRAVTRGLDPNVPMKDSGVEWLGEIPAHWDIAPVYARYEVALGKMLDTKRVTGESSGRYLRNVDVQWDAVNVEDLPKMDFPSSERNRYLLRPEDLLVCEGGEVGRTAIWDGELDECFYQKAIHRMRPWSDSEIPRFFYFLMYALAKRGVFTAGGNPNTIDHLTAVQLRHYRVPFPGTSEQHSITVFLDRKTAKIDALIAKVDEAIDHLREFRTALISAAVTGKIDVREEGS